MLQARLIGAEREISCSVNRPPRSLWLVLALLFAAALLISVPAVRAPDASDVCNAPSFEERDELEAEKESAAIVVLVGALASLVATVIAFATAAGRPRRSPVPLLLGGLGLTGVFAGLFVAFLTALIVC